MQFEELQALLKKYQLTPNKLRGQNFLVSDEVLEKTITTAKLTKEDLVLEVGPGLGALTRELVKVAGQVISFEVDHNLKPLLNKLEEGNNNLQIYWQDILSLTDIQWQKIVLANPNHQYKVVANIPYYLTGKIIPQFINAKLQPVSITLLVQKEVAERIVQKNNKHSLLSLAVAFYAQAKIITLVPAQDFYPQPKVDSALIQIDNIKPWSAKVEEKRVWQLVHHGFANKRKKLANNLASDPTLDKNKIQEIFSNLKLDKNIRAEDMSVANWLDLTSKIQKIS